MSLFCSHKCDYTYRTIKGTGFYQKGEQNIEFKVLGHAGICRCGKGLFFPDHPNMLPVEIEEVADERKTSKAVA